MNCIHLTVSWLIACTAVSEMASAAVCSREAKANKDYLEGSGEGSSFEEAKSAAISDALSVLGFQLETSSQLLSSEREVKAERKITTDATFFAQGFEVLSACEDKGRHLVRMGTKKDLLFRLIANRALERKKWLLDTLESLGDNPPSAQITKYQKELKKFLAEEGRDIEQWVILGRPDRLFPRLDEKEFSRLKPKKKDGKTLRIHAASDPISEKTVNILSKHLRSQGWETSITKSPAEGSALWECIAVRGSAVGTSVRFQVQCSLHSDDDPIEDFEGQGITTNDNVDDQAIRLIMSHLKKNN